MVKNTSLGMDQNIEAFLSYLLGFITGIIFLVAERKNKFVKVHAAQSTIWFLLLFIVSVILGMFSMIPFIGFLVMFFNFLLFLLSIGTWIWLMVATYKGGDPAIPVIRKIAEDFAKKL